MNTMKVFMKTFCVSLFLILSRNNSLAAQDSSQTEQSMPGMEHHHAHGGPSSLIEEILHHGTSGTTVEPDSTPHEMFVLEKGDWRLILHGVAFLNALQQSGPRGGDK